MRKSEWPEWTHLCLPMEYESRRSFVTSIGWKDPRDSDGELLWPERFGHPEVASLKSNLGSWRAAGQLQQRPEPQGGGIIKRVHWQLWPPGGEEFDELGQPVKPTAYPPMDYILACLDSAYTTDNMNDPSALTVWGVFSGETVARDVRWGDGRHSHRVFGESSQRVMLMYAWSGRLELHELVAHVAKMCGRKKPGLGVDKLVIEAKASGISVAQEMRRLFAFEGFGIQLFDPGRVDKVARLYSVQNIFEERAVWAPDRSWAEEVIAQCGTFPNAAHDDYVDTVSMALRHLRDIGMLTRPAERMADLDEGLNVLSRHRYTPLYPG
jgi:predicted phage terminase large subunit-like protein